MSLRKVVITGISSLLGSHLARRLNGQFEILGLSRNPDKNIKNITSLSLDISDKEALVSFLKKTEFDLVINCAAMTDVDLCETKRDFAHRINFEAPAVMADFCRRQSRLLIHLSTDYLFDGKSGPYPEEAIPNPINYYGLTKLEAENAIVESGCPHIIVRTNHLYGNLPDGPSRLVRWMLEARTHQIRAAGDQYNNSTWAGNLADSIIELMTSGFEGVINIGGPDYLSRHEFALRGAEVFGVDKENIIKVPISELGTAAPRPLKAGLTIDKMKMILRTIPVSVLDGLRKVRDGAL